MAKRVLQDNEIALGRAILLATDAMDMSAEGAFWLYDKGESVWRFFLVTSMFSKIDPREVYSCLDAALSKILSEHEVREQSIFIASPEEKLVKDIQAQINTEPYVSEPVQWKVKIDGRAFDAVVYRLTKDLAKDEIKRVQRRFRKSCRALEAA